MSETMTRRTAPDADLPVSLRVIEAVADAKGVAADELGPLDEYVDLEALDAVVASAGDDLCISLSVDEHWIAVDGTGSVTVS